MNSIIGNKKIRQSNFELLRIISMFMVLVLHADFIALGEPNKMDIISSPWISSIKVLLEMASIVAVNVFVLISGWFGIRPSVKGFLNFVFQCLFFSIGIYLIMILVGNQEFSIRGLISCFTFNGSYWFVLAYLCLYILSPILNVFLQHTHKRTQLVILISFFTFQTLFAWLLDGAIFLRRGYSTLSFIGLYLLINYIKKYLDYKNLNCGLCYLLLIILSAVLFLLAKYLGCYFITNRLFEYSNPIVIVSSVSLVLFFSTIKIHNIIINYIAKSCFAVYLLHCNSYIWEFFLGTIRGNMINQTPLEYFHVFAIIVIWFVLAILIDQVRLLLWNLVLKLVSPLLERWT